MPSWICALSGPEKSRAKAEIALEDAGLPLLPDGHHALMDWRSKFPDDKDAWLTVIAEHPDEAMRAVEKVKGWRLRMHYETPERLVCGVTGCDGTQKANGLCETHAAVNVYAELDRLRAEVARLSK